MYRCRPCSPQRSLRRPKSGYSATAPGRCAIHDYLLRCLVSCGRCGLAHHIWTNGHYAYYRCRGADTLLNRLRPDPCRACQLPAADLDALVWADICAMLDGPSILEEALRQAHQGWLHPDEQAARRADFVPRQRDLQRQIERLIDAYTAGVLALEELGARRRKLEERLAAVQREEHRLVASMPQDVQTQHVAAGMERFREQVGGRLAHADFATRRAIVELVVDRVVVDAPEVEIRYVIPFTGAAQRKGVLRPHYRAGPSRYQAALLPHARLRLHRLGGPLLQRS